ncbi:MAG TPA: FtsX-like permease family protein [Candidatus Bathyarchaeia archaeon]|nr:FtsX-like permease family protein [Candidatus Bathyarchaeia archaeon]
MRARDIFGYSFSAIRLRKLRAGLTTLGVVIGIAAIVALLSITQGLQNTITGELQKGLATDTLIVTVGGGALGGAQGDGGGFGGGLGGGGDSDFKLLINDTQTILDLSPGNITSALAVIQRPGNISSAETNRTTTVVGVDLAEYKRVYSSTFVAESGEIPDAPGNDTVVIGKRVSDPRLNGTTLFSAGDMVTIFWLNSSVRPPIIENYTAQVAAVLEEVGGFGFGGPSDTSIYIPIVQAQGFFDTDQCDNIIVKLVNSDESTINYVSQRIEKSEEFAGEVSVISSTAVVELLQSIISLVSLFLVGIAAISLLVAGIGIMNIMIVSLIERTREIGILKALGMRSRTVLGIFLGESVIIGVIGATIGIILGWGLANVVAILFSSGLFGGGMGGGQAAGGGLGITPVLTPFVFLGAFGFGIGVSVIFALYPAWRASKLKPVEALRYE